MTSARTSSVAGLAPNSPRLIIVDGHAYAYRSFYAIRQLTSPSGAPTNAIYGFIKTLGRLMAWLQPTHGVVAWDGGLAAERTASLPEYKAQRPPMPPALTQQLEGIMAYLEAARIASLSQEGVEADDWVATLVRQAKTRAVPALIASSDKDFMQLVAEDVGLINPMDKTPEVWTADHVRAKTGVAPAQVVDWLSLVGDTVDNIPGVAGIGPKNASKLIRQFGSLDQLYARLDQVQPEPLRDKLRTAAEQVRRNQQLIRLRDDLPCGLPWDDLAVRPAEAGRLQALYEAWGFKSLLRELQAEAPRQGELL